jgi:hypothetical protein
VNENPDVSLLEQLEAESGQVSETNGTSCRSVCLEFSTIMTFVMFTRDPNDYASH